ncbi:MAG: molybdopterin cofactor-binding domain-containing protein [Reichenbachiella sp.]|uniref:xanthine dehydrogenase family protein molybdopterin-binding subunit n=1 Tax=Reichenbachiella sp. TaxID=2184521 RepID=UPI002965F42D|nr:molybdopterin cofactor-binding domain-containing protein [Reichenbachiella sp.]MDW3209804.1 molybdopterin cofactor-binding domain-containing protein [Reichenbachiella sp.]
MKTSRREFLKVSSLAGGGFMLAVSVPGVAKLIQAGNQTDLPELNHFLSIDLDGNVIFQLTAHEMGQGSGTGLPMILAEELGADWSKVRVNRAGYDKKFIGVIRETTGGSGTIQDQWDLMRRMGATAREMLKSAAANQWKVSVDQLKVEEGWVMETGTTRRLSFGELAEAASKLKAPEEVEFKKPADFKIVGQSVRNLITDHVVTGKGNYGINVDLPDMVYASIEKCPVYKGKLKSFDDTEALKVNGVMQVFALPALEPAEDMNHIQEGVVVIANSTWAAFKGRKALKIDWDLGDNSNNSNKKIEDDFNKAGEQFEEPVYTQGDYQKVKNEEGTREIEATYINPHQAHALMEPMNATAHYDGDRCQIWVGTQNASSVVLNVAKAVDIPDDKIEVHTQNSGGSFGRRYYPDTSIEAAYISKQIKKPVKLTWTREDGIQHDYFHPYQESRFSALLKEDQLVGMQVKLIKTVDYGSGDHLWENPYPVDNMDTYLNAVDGLVHQGAWRSVQVHSSSMGKECFIDEVAIALEKDPVALRNELLTKEIETVKFNRPTRPGQQPFDEIVKEFRIQIRDKYLSVLNYVEKEGLWEKAKTEGGGRGFAMEDFFANTVCAHIVEVEKDNSDWGIRIKKITSVLDCGIVVNPHFGRGQVEGSIIWALSAMKYGGIDIKNGVVQQSNFHNNKLLRIDEVPEIEVHFVPSEEPPTGLGEPATPPLAPAVLNAIYDATGRRIRKLPVTREDIIS